MLFVTILVAFAILMEVPWVPAGKDPDAGPEGTE